MQRRARSPMGRPCAALAPASKPIRGGRRVLARCAARRGGPRGGRQVAGLDAADRADDVRRARGAGSRSHVTWARAQAGAPRAGGGSRISTKAAAVRQHGVDWPSSDSSSCGRSAGHRAVPIRFFDVAAGAVDLLIDEAPSAADSSRRTRGLSRGSRSPSRTTSALITTRRAWPHVPAWYVVDAARAAPAWRLRHDQGGRVAP